MADEHWKLPAPSRLQLPALRSGDDEIDLPATALRAHKPGVPIRDRHLGAVALGYLGRVGFDLVPAIETPDDQPHMARSGVAKGHRRAAVRFWHLKPLLLSPREHIVRKIN
jgi:hypothetical protein